MSWENRKPSLEPEPRQFIRLLNPDGSLSDTHSRVKSYVSYDQYNDLWEVIDSMNQVRIISAAEPQSLTQTEWVEVAWE